MTPATGPGGRRYTPIAGRYFMQLVGLASAGTVWVTVAGVAFIALLTGVCYRGIEVSARLQQVLLVIEVGALAVFAVVALVKAGTGHALPGAACRVIADRGADATRFADVAAESGVPVSTLQYYFGSREDLLVAAFRHASSTEIAELEAEVAGIADPWEQLERILTRSLTGYEPDAPDAGRLWIESWHFGIRDPEMRADALTLDVEAVHAMAPGAKVVFVGASNCLEGLDNAWAETIDNHVADVITNSWTDGTDDITLLGTDYVEFYEQFSTEAALTGITVNFSCGDGATTPPAAPTWPSKTVEFPADLPYVTGVGGTSVFIGSHRQWLGEYGWQTSYSTLTNGAWTPAPPGDYSSGGGGGTSQLFTQPWYQAGKVPASISEYYSSTPMRAVPDIAMDGDPNTGMIVGETQVFPDGTYWDQYRIGGTSLSSPLLAGVVAVANQAHHHPLGFINPLYYRLLGTSALHDTVAPTSPVAQVRTDYTNFLDNSQGKFWRLQTVDVQSSTLHDTPGYDNETGVGTPHGPAFFLRR